MLLPVLFATIISVSCTKGELSADPPSDNTGDVSTVNKTIMLQLVNEARQKGCQCGNTYYNPVPALSWNNLLEKAAYNHSNDMLQKNYFSHTAPDGSNAGVRIERAGYNWMAYGENIGLGYKNEKEVVEAWLKSPGHCKNIMDGKFREMGVAKAGGYWTQKLAAK